MKKRGGQVRGNADADELLVSYTRLAGSNCMTYIYGIQYYHHGHETLHPRNMDTRNRRRALSQVKTVEITKRKRVGEGSRWCGACHFYSIYIYIVEILYIYIKTAAARASSTRLFVVDGVGHRGRQANSKSRWWTWFFNSRFRYPSAGSRKEKVRPK